jgi:hypothetical protein
MGLVTFRNDARISNREREELRLFASEAGQSIQGLARRLGLRVDEENLPNELSAVLLRSPNCGSPSGYRIAVNRRHSPERQRWSIAHEIGHYVLHKDDPDFEVIVDDQEYGVVVPLVAPVGNSYRSNRRSRLESEAESFAASLLMPPKLVRLSINFRRLCIPKLAQEFYVSEQAMRRRVSEIKAERALLAA